MATPVPALRTSLIPIFVARLDLLMAIVPGLRELPQPCLDELQSLLERAQKLIGQSTGLPISSESTLRPALDLWTPSHHKGGGESVRAIELCAICDNRNCGATVILSALGADKKHYYRASDSIELTCPACGKSFTILITAMERVHVSEDQLQTGFFGGRRSAGASG
jgi:hypothetical protein